MDITVSSSWENSENPIILQSQCQEHPFLRFCCKANAQAAVAPAGWLEKEEEKPVEAWAAAAFSTSALPQGAALRVVAVVLYCSSACIHS